MDNNLATLNSYIVNIGALISSSKCIIHTIFYDLCFMVAHVEKMKQSSVNVPQLYRI